MKVRRPAVAGRFYPDDPKILRQWILSYKSDVVYSGALGGITPHAGYMFSGDLACKVISSMENVDTVVILGPNHTGLGPIFSVSDADLWVTPLGEVKIDEDVRDLILEVDSNMELDSKAHLYEHSIEVQIPIIQVFFPDACIVPITVMGGLTPNVYIELGKSLSSVHHQAGKRMVWLVSSDMNHYEDHETTIAKDNLAISAIETLDPWELWRVVIENDISMCGIYPAITVLGLMRTLGEVDVKPIGHKTSAEASGDYSQVVGYFGCIFL